LKLTLSILISILLVASPLRAEKPRIVSLNPCLDSILLHVADPEQIIAISHYSHEPSATSVSLDIALKFPITTGTTEEVIALKPDLVLAGRHTALATRNALARLNIDVFLSGVPQNIAESKAQILEIAKVVNQTERGTSLVQEISALYDTPYSGSLVPTLMRDSSGLVPGKNTLIDAVLTHTGFENIGASYGVKWWGIVPLEVLMAQPPFVLLTDIHASNRFILHRATKRLKKYVHIKDFPRRLLNCAGPTLIETTRHLMAVRAGFP
jgi:iron complex transport system substrate-binding protein